MPVSEDKTDRPHAPQKFWRRWLWLAIYLPVWVFCAAWYWLGMSGGGWIMAYGILTLVVLLPLTTLASSALVGWRQDFGFWRWGAVALFPALYELHILVTTSLSTALGFTKIAPLGAAVILYPAVAAVLGLLIGMGIRTLWNAVRKKHTDS